MVRGQIRDIEELGDPVGVVGLLAIITMLRKPFSAAIEQAFRWMERQVARLEWI